MADCSGVNANESNEPAPVKKTGEPASHDDQQAAATTPPLEQISPDFGSNGVGQVE